MPALQPASLVTMEGGACGSLWPENVGILAMEVYFPSYYVDQDALEDFDGVSKGRYTIGLGQKGMGFCDDLEDVNSMALTVVQRLLESTENVSFCNIGRVEVGTETILDKSKSVKTVVMQLFESSGNSSIDGVDTTNACYGGTSALFNAINWIESSSWDGRFAIVIAVDSAVYAPGNARCSGGAGAIAMLIGPNAPLVFDRGLRGIHMQHAYDFYKPDMTSEYPVVDGKLSIKCYLSALDKCYKRYFDKANGRAKMCNGNHARRSLEALDFFVFHTPFCKMVQKSFGRCHFIDFVDQCATGHFSDTEAFKPLLQFREVSLDDTLVDDAVLKAVERASVLSSANHFEKMTKSSLLLAQNVGNMYTASLYGSLASLLTCESEESLVGKKVALFSYGSGLASAMFSLTVCPETKLIPKFHQLKTSLEVLQEKLQKRLVVSPGRFNDILAKREQTHHTSNYQPNGSVDDLFPGTYYLTCVDDKFRRFYARKPLDISS